MKKNALIRIFAAILALFSLLSLISCNAGNGDMENTGENETTLDTTEAPTEAETDPPVDPATDGNVRVLLCSDLHYTYLETYFGMPADDRMQHFVDSVLAEHQKQPIDLLIIGGDTSLDHWFDYGSYTKDKISTTLTLREKYLSQLTKAGIPMYILPGNHEQFNNDQWGQIAGNKRYGTVEVEGNLFIMLDAFSVDLEPNYDNNPSYAKHDVDYIRKQMALHPDCKNVYLVSHYFDYKNESAAFKELILDKRIKGLFQGHTHTNKTIDMGADYGNKKIAETGHFSHYTASKDPEVLKQNFWGFRDLVITPTSAICKYVIVETKIVVSGRVLMDLKRTTLNPVRFY